MNAGGWPLYIFLILFISTSQVLGVRWLEYPEPSTKSERIQKQIELETLEFLAPLLIRESRPTLTEQISYLISKWRNDDLARLDSLLSVLIDQQFLFYMRYTNKSTTSLMKSLWMTKDWIFFSKSPEVLFVSTPLGKLEVGSKGTLRWMIDHRLEHLPLLLKLIKMIVLTHMAVPQIEMIESHSVPFNQRAHPIPSGMTQIAAYWTYFNWIRLQRLREPLLHTIRSSGLELSDIREFQLSIESAVKMSDTTAINRIIGTTYPEVSLKPHLRQFVSDWYYGRAHSLEWPTEEGSSKLYPNAEVPAPVAPIPQNKVIYFNFGYQHETPNSCAYTLQE